MSAPRLGLVWAQAAGGVIGRDGEMPWHLPADLAHFRRVTMGAPVVMGRHTWESLPERFRPLPGRANIVVTRDPAWAAPGARRAESPAAALALARELIAAGETPGADTVWVMGGGQLYRAALPLADVLEVTHIAAEIAGDTTAPPIGPEWRLAACDPAAGEHRDAASGLGYRFCRYERAEISGNSARQSAANAADPAP